MPAYYLEAAVVTLGLALLIMECFLGRTDRRAIAYLAITGLAGIFVATFFAAGTPPVPIDAPPTTMGGPAGLWSFYTADPLALFYKAFALLITILVLLMAVDYSPVLERFVSKSSQHGGLGEYYCLPVFVCAGLMWMASANDITTIFVSLETVTVAFYVLVAYLRHNSGSLEAGVKYLILGALSTGFFVYGLAWLFGVTGATNLDQIGFALQGAAAEHKPAALFAFALILVGLGFKVAAVPFQIWIPDVYQGAPTPTTTFLSVGSKAAGFIVLTRMLEPFLKVAELRSEVVAILLVVAGATLVYGSLAAIPQSNFKRLLAYSSISNAGFLLLALACASPQRFHLSPSTVVAFYLASYLLMTVLCFFVLAIVRRVDGSEEISAFDGLHHRSPFLAFALLIGVVSLAGVPLTAGFIGKLFVFGLAVDQGHYLALAIGILAAAAGFYYYFKVARAIYWNPPADRAAPITVTPGVRATLLALVAAIFVLGVYPTPALRLLDGPAAADPIASNPNNNTTHMAGGTPARIALPANPPAAGATR